MAERGRGIRWISGTDKVRENMDGEEDDTGGNADEMSQ